MGEDFSKFVRGFSITAVGVFYSSMMFYAGALVAVNLLGPTQYGLFSLAYMVPSIAIFFLLFGLDITTARYIAHNLGKNNEEKALLCAQTIFLVELCVAFLSVIVFFILADSIALLLGEDIVFGLQLLSVYIGAYLVIRYLMGVLQGYFLLKERALIEMLSNTLNLVLLVPFVYFGFGYVSPILSYMFAFMFAIGLAVYYLERAHIPVFRFKFEGFQALREYLKFSFYVYLNDSFRTVYVWIGTVVIAFYSMPVETVGYYRAMSSITNTVVLISYGLTVVLYPMLSELNARKDYARLSFGLRKVIKLTLALSIPAAFGMLFISHSLVAVVFPKYLPAVLLLRIFSFRMIFLPLWSILATALITLNRAKEQALLSFFLCIIAFGSSMLFGMISVEGIALANTSALAIAAVLQYNIFKRGTIDVSIGPVVKFSFSSAVMCTVVWLILQLAVGDVARIGLSLIFGIAVYGVLVLKTGAISRNDIEMVRSGISTFGRAGRGLELLLDLAQKVQNW
jgi:O-antigen/teichoic acid export membrane protein